MNRLCVLALAVTAGCSSLVDNPCASGYALHGGQCVIAGNGPDAGGDDGGSNMPPDGGSNVPPDALVCTAPDVACDGKCIDVSSDPDNCGACHHVCASGICTMGHCEGDLSGHIVAIGHDYRTHHAAMARVVGNAVALAAPHDPGVCFFTGSAAGAAIVGTRTSVGEAMTAIGRPWHEVKLPEGPASLTGIDVLVVDAQTAAGDVSEAAALPWAQPIDLLLQRGGIVVVLEGSGGSSFRFAKGANLFTVGTPVDATGQATLVTGGGDAIAQQVLSPYLAETTSVTFPSAPPAVISTLGGGTVVFHTTKY